MHKGNVVEPEPFQERDGITMRWSFDSAKEERADDDDVVEGATADDRLVRLPQRLADHVVVDEVRRLTDSDWLGGPVGQHQCQVSCWRQSRTECRAGSTGAPTVREGVDERGICIALGARRRARNDE
jgi:hypothetical protein